MHFISYCLIRTFGFFVSLLPYPILHALGRSVGTVCYYFHAPFRKTALSNLAIAYGDKLSEKERKKLAKKCFQSLLITCLEFFRPRYHVTFQERRDILDLLDAKKGVIFLTAHQANWEVPFIKLTETYPGVAIGRPIKNRWLYRWVLSVRERHRGKIIMPRQAVHEGTRALLSGKFMGIVGDQAHPKSPYSYPLFGTRAWTAPTPALLAHKTDTPLVVVTTKRVGYRYEVSGSPAIWPDKNIPIKEDAYRMMDEAMGYLQQGIERAPEQWMWVHDRWKQQGVDHVKRQYRHGFILVVLPPKANPAIPPLLKRIYPRSYLTFMVPEGLNLPDYETITYKSESDRFIRDYRFRFLIDFTDSKPLRRHFSHLACLRTLALPQELSIIQETLIKPECLPKEPE